MNKFLKQMDITFRRDPTNFRPRINELGSQYDQEQKLSGNYFLMGDEWEEDEMKAIAAMKKRQELEWTLPRKE